MSIENEEPAMKTEPLKEHKWLQRLAGDWKTETEMNMPDGSTATGKGTEKVKILGGLWAYGEGKSTMPDGEEMEYKTGLGYDVTFKEYRGFTIMSVSSHLWKYMCTLSEDGNTMTMDCEGPNMMGEGTAMYRDTIEIQDDDHRTLTSTGPGPDGEWVTFMKSSYTRV